MLTVAFCFSKKEINNYFYFPLLQAGYKVSGFTALDSLSKYLENSECDLLILDYDDFGEHDENILAKIRVLSEKTKIVVLTQISNFLIKDILVRYKVYGVVPKPMAYPRILEEVKNYINLIEKNPGNTLRKHPRFKIDNVQPNLIKIDFENIDNFSIGSLTDISLGGIGVIVNKDVNPYLVFRGKKVNAVMEIEKLKLNFNGKIENFDGKRKMGVRFVDIKHGDLLKIKEYILNLMMKEKKE
ncbi:MAG TPA: hypothetical protein DHW82_01830 [Spirochaetia bacterium]|nr:MAG: hypothetical protein A2Y41_13875 [Spirochaetes bacterium GWB1_36_13]HCL55735.1 hypothetical protein [Spirochaetia bacterium]